MSLANEETRRAKVQQLALDWREWGGARVGAGRKRTVRSRVPYRKREIRREKPVLWLRHQQECSARRTSQRMAVGTV